MFVIRKVLSEEEKKLAILEIASTITPFQRAFVIDVVLCIGAASMPARRKLARARASRILTIYSA